MIPHTVLYEIIPKFVVVVVVVVGKAD